MFILFLSWIHLIFTRMRNNMRRLFDMKGNRDESISNGISISFKFIS